MGRTALVFRLALLYWIVSTRTCLVVVVVVKKKRRLIIFSHFLRVDLFWKILLLLLWAVCVLGVRQLKAAMMRYTTICTEEPLGWDTTWHVKLKGG